MVSLRHGELMRPDTLCRYEAFGARRSALRGVQNTRHPRPESHQPMVNGLPAGVADRPRYSTDIVLFEYVPAARCQCHRYHAVDLTANSCPGTAVRHSYKLYMAHLIGIYANTVSIRLGTEGIRIQGWGWGCYGPYGDRLGDVTRTNVSH